MTVYRNLMGVYYICEGRIDPELVFFEGLKVVSHEIAEWVLEHENEFKVYPGYGTYYWNPDQSKAKDVVAAM